MAELRSTRISGYSCREVVELVTEYLDGALTPEERTAVEVHLHYCAGCATFLDQIRAAAALSRGLAEEQIPDDVKDALLEVFHDWRRG